uniref:Uncharacterized protein n=1 Tax=Lactuca sativa TaxID=4236 RepID=A0A9R1VT09_LACSA|nr:hypothetical protein LSAT_V11C400209030 [Lactuca sativa]
MDTQNPTSSLHYMNQEFAKLDRFDGQNSTRWFDKVKSMLQVLKLAYVLDRKVTPNLADPIPKVGKNMDPTVIFDLGKQRALCRESKKLCVGHIKKSLSDWLEFVSNLKWLMINLSWSKCMNSKS